MSDSKNCIHPMEQRTPLSPVDRSERCEACGAIMSDGGSHELVVPDTSVIEAILSKLLSTANLTTGAVPYASGYGFASIRLTGVVTKENILRVFARYGVEDPREPPRMDAGDLEV